MAKNQAIIMGAGIQGISCALSLLQKGYQVTLIDKNAKAMNQTSVRGEAKIHLGYVYANDASFRTANLLVNAALHFAPLLDKWTNNLIRWNEIYSNPFTYVVHNDSMLTPQQLLQHYEKISQAFQELKGEGLHYLGDHMEDLKVEEISIPSVINKKYVQKTFTTSERAIQTSVLAPLLRGIIEQKQVKLCMNETVKSVKKIANGFEVEVEDASGKKNLHQSDIVVNCLWDGRLAVDASLNLLPQKDWVYRLKYRFLGNLPASLNKMESYTLVLGPFGDIVTYPNGLTYLSWYPECMRGWSQEIKPPKDWETISSIDKSDRDLDWIIKAVANFSDIFPGLDKFDIQQIDAGVIFSWGKTDIDDPISILHKRYNIGVTLHDGYFSIDTGKFTSAPLFAQSLSDLL
jgi:hypothetical protein